MDRVSAANYVTVGGKRMFQDINPGAGILNGTELAATWHNGAQESICLAQEAVGQVSSDADNTQLTKAIAALGGGNVTSVTASGALLGLQAGLVLVSAAGGNVAVTLPAANSLGGYPIRFSFVRTDSTANTVTITAAGTDTIEPAGTGSITLSGANDAAQLASNGIGQWVMPGAATRVQQVFVNTAGTSNVVVPPGFSRARLKSWGGGGAGGGSGATYGGAGGCGGNSAEEIATGIGGATLAVTVGAGGAPGASGGGNGGAGGASSVAIGGTTLVLANGGNGGEGGTAGGATPAGGTPGAAGVGTVQMTAGHGAGAAGGSGSSAAGGGGSGGGGPNGGASTPGSPGGGGAGSGGGTAQAGSAGGVGGVLIEFF